VIATAFQECPVCGSPVAITDDGLVYCPVCEPQKRVAAVLPFHRNACPRCHGLAARSSCVPCAGSGVSRPDAAMREHWGYRKGYRAHGMGLGAATSPFGHGTFADRCWRAGWQRAERDDIAASHAEKIDAERAYGGLAL
jgi:hypothetical protein